MHPALSCSPGGQLDIFPCSTSHWVVMHWLWWDLGHIQTLGLMWHNSEILQVLLKWGSLTPSASFSSSLNEDTRTMVKRCCSLTQKIFKPVSTVNNLGKTMFSSAKLFFIGEIPSVSYPVIQCLCWWGKAEFLRIRHAAFPMLYTALYIQILILHKYFFLISFWISLQL